MDHADELTRDSVYRDSKNWYRNLPRGAGYSDKLLAFCLERAGKEILDYGCATGEYCVQLQKRGYRCQGADTNQEYIRQALIKGVKAHLIQDKLPFEDKSFDTVLMFELLEHVQDPGSVLKEAGRVARKNILITVPDNSEFLMLKACGLTYEHMLELDHLRFFTQESLSRLLAEHFPRWRVNRGEPLAVYRLLPWYIRKPVSLLVRLGLYRPLVYFRLYAEAELRM